MLTTPKKVKYVKKYSAGTAINQTPEMAKAKVFLNRQESYASSKHDALNYVVFNHSRFDFFDLFPSQWPLRSQI